MKYIYACDIHGDKNKYEKLYEVLLKENIKYLVLGGDMLPKHCNRKVEQPKFINEYLSEYFSKLRDNNITCICILGNDDLEELDNVFDNICKKYDNVYNIDKKKADIEDVTLIGMSNVLDHPFGCKDRVVIENDQKMPIQLSSIIKVNNNEISILEWEEYRKDRVTYMGELLEKLPKSEKDKKTIYIFHNPPFGIGLDVCMDRRQVGSKAITKFLESSNVYMSMHGHIHESPSVSNVWYNKINNTVCIQPGQTEIGSSNMYYVIVDTKKDKYERIIEKI